MTAGDPRFVWHRFGIVYTSNRTNELVNAARASIDFNTGGSLAIAAAACNRRRCRQQLLAVPS